VLKAQYIIGYFAEADNLSFSSRIGQEVKMQRYLFAVLFVGGAWLAGACSPAPAAPCLMVTLTGTQSGPPVFNGLAGAGTLVRYGDDSNECGALKLQFDAGRGTILRLSQVGVLPSQLNAMFFTHMHSDHTEGFAELVQLRWNFNSAGPRLDVVCSEDAISTLGFTLSCKKFVMHIADPLIQSGEISQRVSEDNQRLPGGPAGMINLVTFQPTNEPQIVWTSGEVRVSAIRSTHIAGHASYRVDTPAGSVVIGGDASNDTPEPPRLTSTSDQVEKLAKGADIIVHSTMHPALAPDKDSGMPPPVYYRQAATADLGAMAQRAGARYLMLTHLAPPLGAQSHGPYKVPGGPLTEADYRKVAEAGGFTGIIIVGTDLATVRLPTK
jgi:ribonuclease Z